MDAANGKHIDEYSALRPKYLLFSDSIRGLLESLITAHDIKYHVIEARAKTIESFAEKIKRPSKNYTNPLSQITDLCGARIICYFSDDVQKIVEIIKQEFKILEEEKSHQPEKLNVDQFGYLSYHLVVNLNSTREGLIEWRDFKGFSAEIQIRTVIQHAWSAVSHTVQYKRELEMPSPFRRRLHRIAGLFEIADEEFVAIRDQRISLKESAKSQIADGYTNIKITPDSISAFLDNWPGLGRVEQAASKAGFKMDVEGYQDRADYSPTISLLASKAGYTSVSELEESLANIDDNYLTALSQESSGNWYASVGFIILLMIVLAADGKVTKNDLVQSGFHESIAARVIRVANASRPASKPKRSTRTRKQD